MRLRESNKNNYSVFETASTPIKYNTIVRIISEKLGIFEHKILENSQLQDDLGADSLDQVELIMAFEDEFDLEINDVEADRLGPNCTPAQIFETLRKLWLILKTKNIG